MTSREFQVNTTGTLFLSALGLQHAAAAAAAAA
jgi:hypothetical protein